MTLTTPYSATFITGDGETKTFPYLFDEVSENFITVIVYNALTGITSTPTYIVDTDQKQVIFGDDTPAPTADETICIYRNTPNVQDVPFRTLHGYDAKTLENILSKIVAMIQEIKSTYFSTQVLQGDPWQLDLLTSADDGATVNIDYTAKKLVKGLYFKIVDGNLKVSADDSNYITMPKSVDVAEFRQKEVILPDLSVVYKLEYRVGNTWYDAGAIAEGKAEEAIRIAEEARDIATDAKDIAEDAKETAEGIDEKAQEALDNSEEALDKVTQEITDREDADEDLQDQIDNLSGRGRFLALWNCATGLAESNPPESPYTYKAGDYFVVGTVSSATPAVNYKPDGSSYTTGTASTTVETNEVSVNDTYFYDGSVWKLQSNAQKEVSFSALAGSPYDNTSLSNALNAKQNVFQVETLPTPSVSEDGKIYEYVGETIRTKHEFITGEQGERTGTLSGYVSDTSILKTKLASINTELGIDCDRLKFVVVANTSGYYYDVYACEGETETLYQQNTSATSSYGIRIGVVSSSAIGTYIYFDMIFDDEYNYSGNFYKCFKRVVIGEKPSVMYVNITNLDLVNSKIAEANETFGITTAKLKFVLTMTGNNQFTVYAVEGDGTEHLMQADINVSNLPSTFGVQIAQTGNWTVGLYAELEYQYYWNEVLELAHLSDVELKDLEDGQALIYDADTGKWTNGNGGVSATYDATTKTITFA